MSRRDPLLAVVLCAALLSGCRSEPEPEPRIMQVELAIDGMTCDSCVQAITYELERLDGVRSVEVDLDGGKAIVVFTEGRSEATVIEQAIERVGYQAEPREAVAIESP